MDRVVAAFLRHYPQYTHFHIYHTPYRKGGITLDQLFFLVEDAFKQKRNDTLMLAGMHGVDVSKLLTEEEKKEQVSKKEKVYNPNEPLFGDPEMYKNMTEEEKQKATEAMMAKLKKTGLPVKMNTKR